MKNNLFYLRLIGSHKTQVGTGKQVLDRSDLIEEIVEKLELAFTDNPNKKTAMVYINQHFSGYAPPVAGKFREILEERKMSVIKPEKSSFKGQQKLSEFFG